MLCAGTQGVGCGQKGHEEGEAAMQAAVESGPEAQLLHTLHAAAPFRTVGQEDGRTNGVCARTDGGEDTKPEKARDRFLRALIFHFHIHYISPFPFLHLFATQPHTQIPDDMFKPHTLFTTPIRSAQSYVYVYTSP